MKCYYEVLGVPRDATPNDLKQSYRKLALQWHPDKNPHNQVEAKEQFQLLQQAYEVLSDPHERAWYDNHREAILKGGVGEDYKDESIDLFQYFSPSCFKGYGDDEKGFYAVYRRVFETIVAEDMEFAEDGDSDDEMPTFGRSDSSYEDVVHPFYAYWQSYSTKRSYAWLDPYDVREISNRRVFRMVEKENKKVRDRAKRERNEQVRNLVAFIRKRDKRVQAHAQKLAEKAQENARKAKERQRQQLLERQKEYMEHKVDEWSKFSNIESELKTIEANLAKEFGEELSGSDEYDIEKDALYCVACNKIFKKQKAFSNHEKSKKHQEKVIAMTAAMHEDDKKFSYSDEEEDSEQSDSMEEEAEKSTQKQSSKEKKTDKKPATGHGMPDFLLNPEPTRETEDYVASEGELMSDSDEDSEDDGSLSQNKLGAKQKGKIADGNEQKNGQVDSSSYIFPGTEEPIKNSEKADEEHLTSEGELLSDEEDSEEDSWAISSKKKNKKKNKQKAVKTALKTEDSDEEFDLDLGLSKKQRKKLQNRGKIVKSRQETDLPEDNDKNSEAEENDDISAAKSNAEATSTSVTRKTKGKKAKESRKAKNQSDTKSKPQKQSTKDVESDVGDIEHCCVTCKSEFSSKNKLFDHLKKTGHSVYLPNATKSRKNNEKKRRARDKYASDSD
uniref:DnaJ homolog subfamily C member 21 n=1 Tax=Bracon brevicornis TaxID=1563983 RepID=A0A6V7JJ97_9HYME